MRFIIAIIFLFYCNFLFADNIDNDIRLLLQKTNTLKIYYSDLTVSEHKSLEIYEEIKKELGFINETIAKIESNLYNNELGTIHISYPLINLINELLEELNMLFSEHMKHMNYKSSEILYSLAGFPSEKQCLNIFNHYLIYLRNIIYFYPIDYSNAWIPYSQHIIFKDIDECTKITLNIRAEFYNIFKLNPIEHFSNINKLYAITHNNKNNIFYSFIISELSLLDDMINVTYNTDDQNNIINQIIKIDGIFNYINLLNLYNSSLLR